MSHLDATFSALADPTRRAILARLAKGEATSHGADGAVRDDAACAFASRLAAGFVALDEGTPQQTVERG